jgi:TIGR02453 family protein
MLQASTLKYLKDLSKHNNKPWFDAHRQQYDDAKKDFETFIQTLIDKHGRRDTYIKELTAKNCLFRINRDIRFSKDKTPYKTNMGASISRGGRKSIYAGYYFHLEPGQSFVGGGIWMPMPEETKKVRQEIDYCLDEFRKIVESKKFKTVYGGLYIDSETSLSRVPQGFEKDNPAAEYLKLKSWIATQALKDADITSKDLVKKALVAFETLQPLVEFINRSLED